MVYLRAQTTGKDVISMLHVEDGREGRWMAIALIRLCTHLEVWTRDAARELAKKRLHDLDELTRLNDVKDLLHFTEKHDLLRTVGLGPELQQTHHHLGAGEEEEGEREEKERERERENGDCIKLS